MAKTTRTEKPASAAELFAKRIDVVVWNAERAG